PEPVPGMPAYWRSLLSPFWAKSLWDRFGPVLLNLALRDPLLSQSDPSWLGPLHVHFAGSAHRHPPAPRPARPTLPPALPRQVLLVPAFTARHRPDAVVVLGRPCLSRGVLRFLREAPRTAVVSATPDWDDPTRTASAVHAGPPPDRGTAEADPAWLDAWLRADRAARTALDELIEEHTGLSEPLIAREVAGRVPDGGLLFAGASMPIRDLDGHMAPRSGIRVLANRGTNGIDGTVSTA